MSGLQKKNSRKPLSILFIAGILSLFSFTAFAYDPDHKTSQETTVSNKEHEKKGFDAGKLITEHISDSYGWHLWGVGHSTVSIPLPIILYTDKGLDIFMSSAFHHGTEDVTAKNTYRLEENHIKIVSEGIINEEASAKIFDLSITKNVASLLISAILLVWIFLSIAKSYKKRVGLAPKGFQSFIEPLIMFVRDDVAKPAIGPKYEKFMPYLLTVFFFILINNLMGIIPFAPGGANLTGNIAVTAVLASFTLLIIILNSNGHYWRHIFAMPGVPIPVLIILTPIEILGLFLRPFVLMVRLFANITAGHIIALAFFSLIFIFGEMNTGAGLGVSLLSVAFTVFMGFMELLVAFLQAYVFALLSAMYFGAAIEEGHHDKHHTETSQIDIV